MSSINKIQYGIENLSLWFQGGVKRSVIIFGCVCLVLIVPFYFAGILTANIWNTLGINKQAFDQSVNFIPKNIPERALIISRTEQAPLQTGENALYLSVSNKENPQIGFFPFVYTLQVLDSQDVVLSQEKRTTYLLPSEIKFVITSSANSQGVKLRLIREPETRAVYYNPQSKILRNPNLRVVSQNLEDITFTPNLRIKATIKNEDQIKVGKVDVLYLVRDAQQSVVGIGEFSFTNFLPGTEEQINLIYPKPQDRVARFLDIQWSVNYLDAKNLELI